MKRTDFPRLRREVSGSALIAVYWVIALLSLSVFTTSTILLGDLESQANRGQVFRAEQLAEMGIAIACNPVMNPGDPLLEQDVDTLESYQTTIESETGRINLNATLVAGERPVIERLFWGWGMSETDAAIVVDALIDWVDADDEVTGLGAEQDDYTSSGQPGFPFNRQFWSLDEVLQVRGMDVVAQVQPNWQRAFTLWGNGRLDLADARPEVIAAVCECPLSNAQAFVVHRRGLDGVENTEDDQEMESISELLNFLGVSEAAMDDVSSRVGWGGNVERIRSVGRAGDVRIERIVIVQGRKATVSVLDVQQRRL